MWAELQKVNMQHRHAVELQHVSHAHQQQLDAARLELDRAIELTKQKVGWSPLTHLGALQRKKFQKSELLWKWVGGLTLNFFFVENHPKIVLNQY